MVSHPPSPWDQYGDYLSLDRILDAQIMRSAQAGAPAHDEMLFIIYHQVCELWFRQILFELDDITARFSRDIVDDRDMLPILARMERIVSILKHLVVQVDILETMPPQSFTDFREYLSTASGFQSLQFRLIETRLGLRREDRIPVFHGQFDDMLSDQSRHAIAESEKNPSLFEQLDRWLARTPFTNLGDYAFEAAYRAAVHHMLSDKERAARSTLSGDALDKECAAIEKGREKFDAIFSTQDHQGWRLSKTSLQAALFITLYKQEPVLQSPARLMSLIMDIDEQIALWRTRHALMVQRMVGMSMGTGGSSGYDYLLETIRRHRIFGDLFALSSYLIPSRAMPPLPDTLSREMGYRYGVGA